jgi:hypothetical protein
MSSVRLGRPAGRNFSGGGLPTSPRARSVGRYDVREREIKEHMTRARDSDHYPRHNTGASTRAPPTRPLRPQRSMVNMLPSRGGSSSSYTEVPEVPPLPLPRRSDVSSKSSASSGSYSSASGSSSSAFLDRMKSGREYGYGSSRTSLEEETDPPRKVMGPERGVWFGQRTAAMPESEYSAFTRTPFGDCRGVLMRWAFQVKRTIVTSCRLNQVTACRSGRASQPQLAP